MQRQLNEWSKHDLFTKWCWHNRCPHPKVNKKGNLDGGLISYTHTPLRVGNIPNVKCKITKFLEENVGEKLCKFEFWGEFLGIISKVLSMKLKR